MRCTACDHENRPGARYCLSCGGALALRCTRCGSELPGDARFCDACGTPVDGHPDRPAPRIDAPAHLAERILTSRSALEGERKQVTAMFCDVQGSMDLSEPVDDEEWHRIIDRLFQLCAEGVYRFEGTVNQFLGDGILALFGAPLAHEDHALRACYAALHLRETLDAYARELKRTRGLRFSVRIGINSGEVVVGTIGDDLRMDYTAAGHTVGLAQRMEQLAEPGRAYVSRHTASLVEGYVELADLGSFVIKGVREPIGVYELVGLGPHRTRLDVARARGLGRFVGRRHELGVLEAALEETERGDGCVVTLIGEPGVGKSRLCHEFLERTRASGVKIFEAHGLGHGKAYPFLPILELLRGYFGIDHDTTAVAARQRIAGGLLLLGEEFRETLPLVFDFLGVPDPDLSFPQLDPEVRRNQLLGVISQLIRARSDRGPALIVVDDVHWLDPGSAAFLEQLADAVPGTRTMLLLNTRPPEAPWTGGHRRVELEPLPDDAVAELLADHLGTDPALARLADRIASAAGGNPLFVEEVVRALVEVGVLSGVRGNYRLEAEEPDVVIPPTVQAIIGARLDRLSERSKSVLQAAAVIGREFTEPVLRRVVESSEADLAEIIGALEDAGFVVSTSLYPERECAFRHPLTQDVVYHSQLTEHRRRLHERVAKAIEEIDPDHLDERAAVLAHHWERADQRLPAARWSRRAAEWAGHNDPASALEHWRRVRRHIEGLRDGQVDGLALASCIGVMNSGARLGIDAEEAARLFAEGRELAVRREDLRSEARLLLVYGRLRGMAGHVAEAAEHSVEATRLAEQSGWAGLRLAASVNRSAWHWQSGDLEQSLAVASAATLDTPSHPRLGAEHLGYGPYIWLVMQRGRLLPWLGRCGEAPEALDRAITLAAEHGEREVLCWAHQAYADLGWLSGDAVLAAGHASRALEIAERLGTSLLAWSSQLALGRARLVEGSFVEAADALERSLGIIESTGIGRHAAAFVLAALSEAALAMGQTTRARTLATQAVERAPAEAGAGTWARRALARALIETSDEGEAARLLERLIAAPGHDVAIEPFLHTDLALLAERRGEVERRASALRAAAERFAAIGATARAAATSERLEAPS